MPAFFKNMTLTSLIKTSFLKISGERQPHAKFGATMTFAFRTPLPM